MSNEDILKEVGLVRKSGLWIFENVNECHELIEKAISLTRADTIKKVEELIGIHAKENGWFEDDMVELLGKIKELNSQPEVELGEHQEEPRVRNADQSQNFGDGQDIEKVNSKPFDSMAGVGSNPMGSGNAQNSNKKRATQK